MTDTTTQPQTDAEWTDGTDPVEETTETTETTPVPAAPKVKVPEQLKVRVALALTFSPKDFGYPEGMDINKFRWVVREAVKNLIDGDPTFKKADTVTKVMAD
jgi:hypothetical protein